MQQCFEHVLLRLIAHRPVHRPTGADIGDGQGEAEFAVAVAAFMSHQINLDKSGDHVIPFSPRANRNLGLEQRARLGMGPAMKDHLPMLVSQAPVDG